MLGVKQLSANPQDGHGAGCNLPRVADDEVVPESESALLLTTASLHHTMPYLGGFST
jgi:hypothetical protein